MDEKKQKNHPDIEQTAEVVKEFREDILGSILELEKKCFPKEWQFEDAKEYFAEALRNEKNVNVILREGEKVVGYTLATPHDAFIKEIKQHDPYLKEDKKRYYIETIEILPESTGKGGSKKLMLKACEEAKKRGFNKFSIHARKANHLEDAVKKVFGNGIAEVRQIEHWFYGGDEPYEYIEWSC